MQSIFHNCWNNMVSPQCVFSIELYGYYYVRNISYNGYIDMVSHQSVLIWTESWLFCEKTLLQTFLYVFKIIILWERFGILTGLILSLPFVRVLFYGKYILLAAMIRPIPSLNIHWLLKNTTIREIPVALVSIWPLSSVEPHMG